MVAKYVYPSRPELVFTRWFIAFWLAMTPCTALCQQIVIYPRPESTTDSRASYPLALLKLCEQKSNNSFVLQPSDVHAQQGRSIVQLTNGKGLDIIWTLSNEARENLLLPIRIPIDRGLIGWRLLLIRERDTELFNRTSTRDQLSLLNAGQGHDWPDVDILRVNNFKVVTSSTYEGLFKMLALGHIQYFPRSIAEIWPEESAHKELGINVQQSLIIHYPSAFYFFVNKNNTALANTIESCLKNAIADGSFRKLFDQYHQEAIIKADLSHRTIISLENPLLPKHTPLSTTAYWFSPTEKP